MLEALEPGSSLKAKGAAPLEVLDDAVAWASSANADTRLRLASALALRPCASLSCPNVLATGPGKRCSGCKQLRFCDVICSKAGWKEHHRAACKLLAAEHGGIT